MPSGDFIAVVEWWLILFLLGEAAFPLTQAIFSSWWDRGYFFSKAVGLALVTYFIYIVGTLHLAPFTSTTAIIGAILFFICPILIQKYRVRSVSRPSTSASLPTVWSIVRTVLSELLFFAALLGWTWVKAHEPSIRGLEKFMDYGFTQTILNSPYFPTPDMWWAGGTINYYYFGHLSMAVITKLSGFSLSYGFNLMLATLFAFTFTMSFSIGIELFRRSEEIPALSHKKRHAAWMAVVGIFTALLVSLAGNMQTIYAFTKGYSSDNVVPFWTILWTPAEFFSSLNDGLQRYWYANATRFIPYTIHEFPSYSFVVSDVHGHVLSLPYVFLTIAILITIWFRAMRAPVHSERTDEDLTWREELAGIFRVYPPHLLALYGFMVSVLLMTNAFDGPIYAGLFGFTLLGIHIKRYGKASVARWPRLLVPLAVIGFVAGMTAMPFLTHFSSFATGIGVDCPPAKLQNMKIGPFLFETPDKCQKSPLWMMWLLWGFFWYCGAFLFIRKIFGRLSSSRGLLIIWYVYGILMIIVPEFFYAKDIYPMHFRSNTMFKLGYQAFILWSILSAHVIAKMAYSRFRSAENSIRSKRDFFLRLGFFILLVPQLFLVSIFPFFAIRSYFGELHAYHSIFGLAWFASEYTDDYKAMLWMRDTAGKQGITTGKLPVIVEADGDSYTDFERISAFAGTPTVVGWAVHEWLWRGSYDIVAPRRDVVRLLYQTTDQSLRQSLVDRYQIQYFFIGSLERQKFDNIDEAGIGKIADPVFKSGQTIIYEVRQPKQTAPEFPASGSGTY